MTTTAPCRSVDPITGAVCSLPRTHPQGIGGTVHRDKHDRGVEITWPV